MTDRRRTAKTAALESSLAAFNGTAMNFAWRGIQDWRVRAFYLRNTRIFSQNILKAYNTGEINFATAEKAIRQASNFVKAHAGGRPMPVGEFAARTAIQVRNNEVVKMRKSSDAIARAYAEARKPSSSLPQFEYFLKKYSKKPIDQLNIDELDALFRKIIDAAGRPDQGVSKASKIAGRAGVVLFFIGVGVSAYNIFNANDKVYATEKEAVAWGAGIGGGVLGAAAAGASGGTWAGPWGMAAGALVGGIIGAFVLSEVHEATTNPYQSSGGQIVSSFIRKYTSHFNTDEQGMGKSLITEFGFNVDLVHTVFLVLAAEYSYDADDVAFFYIQEVKKLPAKNLIIEGLRKHEELRKLLIDILEAGWTTSNERSSINFVKQLK